MESREGRARKKSLRVTYRGAVALAVCCNTCPSWITADSFYRSLSIPILRGVYAGTGPEESLHLLESQVEGRNGSSFRFLGSLSSPHRVFINSAHLQHEAAASGVILISCYYRAVRFESFSGPLQDVLS